MKVICRSPNLTRLKGNIHKKWACPLVVSGYGYHSTSQRRYAGKYWPLEKQQFWLLLYVFMPIWHFWCVQWVSVEALQMMWHYVILEMHVADSGIISNDSFTVESRAPPTGHRACYLSGCVQQALPRKEYPVGKQLRGPLQKQLGVVYGLTPPFSQLWGCLHPLAQKTGLLTLKNTHVMNEECKQSLVLDRAFKVVAELSGCVTTFTMIQCLLYLCISSRCLLLNWLVHLGFNKMDDVHAVDFG